MSGHGESDGGGAWPLGRGVTRLVLDEGGLGALDKPPGLLSHPNTSGDETRSLLAASYVPADECFEWTDRAGGRRRLWLLNRLDSATSGVILVATGAALAAAIRSQFQRRRIFKVYHAVVFGAPRQPMELWRDRLAVTKRGERIRTTDSSGHVPAECRMSVVRPGRGEPRLTLLRLEPRTGRSHQLRVQCAKRGVPIVGDQTYGDFRRNRDLARTLGARRLFLHSTETRFDYELDGRLRTFVARSALPAEFGAVLRGPVAGGRPI